MLLLHPPAAPAARATPVAGYRHALHTLQDRQKTAKGAPAYSRFVNRRLGRYLAAAGHVLGWTPNGVTAASAACTATGIVALATLPGSAPVAAGVAAALVAGYALDSADGQLARLRGGGTLAGEWLDHVVDAVKTVGLHAAVLVHLYAAGQRGPALLVPLAYTCVHSVWFFTVILTDQLRRGAGERPGAAAPAGAPVLRSLLALPTDYGVLCLAFLLLAAPSLFLGAYAALLAGTTAVLGAALVSWYGEMRRLDARAGR